jgi:uncharacterized membrane protein YqhA
MPHEPEPRPPYRGESDPGSADLGPGDPAHPSPGPGDPEPRRLPRPAAERIERSLAACLSLAIIPVAFLVLAALGAFVYGAAVFVDSVINIVRHPFPVGHNVGLFLLDIDLFLIGATLLISAIGLYELFIGDIRVGGIARMPAWLEMHDLNDLKGRVLAMIVMVLAVSFVELAVDEDSGLKTLEIGGGVALVIIAVTVFLRLTGHSSSRS